MKTVSLEKIIQLTRDDTDVCQMLLEFPGVEILTHSLSQVQTSQMKAEYPSVFSELPKEAFCVNVISTEMVPPKGYKKIRIYYSNGGKIIKKIMA